MDICPNCGSNIEGLINHCDCCGFCFSETKHLFSARTHEVAYASSIGTILLEFINKLNDSFRKEMIQDIDKVVIQSFSYPLRLLDEMNLKNRIRISKKKREAIVTIVFVCEDFFPLVSQNQHKKVVSDVLSENLETLFKKLQCPNANELVNLVKNVVQEEQ